MLDPEYNVQFAITEDEFRNFGRLLAEQGIMVSIKHRRTEEDLEQGTVSILSHSGKLQHDGREFTYLVDRERTGYCLMVRAPDHGAPLGKAIVEAVRRAFPQPDAGELFLSRESFIEKTIGCVVSAGCLGLIAALIFFLIFGITTYFKW